MTDVQIIQGALQEFANGGAPRARGNRRAEQVVIDFWTQLLFDGRLYHLQLGTEDAPIASTAAIDDALVWAVVDNPVGMCLIPFRAQVLIANWTTATLVNSMLEADMAKVRYSSGGTAFTPRNLRADAPYAYSGGATGAYVGTDITAAAKSAVPDSVELHRGQVVEDAQATPAADAASLAFDYTARLHGQVALIDAGSLVLHHGATTADVNSYGMLQFAQFDKAYAV